MDILCTKPNGGVMDFNSTNIFVKAGQGSLVVENQVRSRQRHQKTLPF